MYMMTACVIMFMIISMVQAFLKYGLLQILVDQNTMTIFQKVHQFQGLLYALVGLLFLTISLFISVVFPILSKQYGYHSESPHDSYYLLDDGEAWSLSEWLNKTSVLKENEKHIA